MTSSCQYNGMHGDANPFIYGKCCRFAIGSANSNLGDVFVKPKMNCPSSWYLSGIMCYPK
ncbi:MAG TPA: hypothetical protein DCL21_07475 [Alphaproteobacteria bacterium]|nr:hypothetical protein [Alphaproteobacteria bacterium]